MKQVFSFLLVFSSIQFALFISSATAQTYSVGTNVVSAGVGLGSSIAGYSYGTQSPGFSLQYERGLWQAGPGVVSLGGYLGFKSYKYSASDGYGDNYSDKWSYTIIGVRGAWHFTGLEIPNLDLYGGVMLSYNDLKFTESYSNSTGNYHGSASGSYGSAVGFSVYAGARYFFAHNLGAYAELGYGVSYLNLGLSYKF
jgi:hypothetical protein